MKITIELSPSHAQRLINALCAKYQYDSQKQEGETKEQFAKQAHMNILKSITTLHERDEAVKAASVSEITITQG